MMMDWVTASKHFVLIVESGSFAEAARRRFTSTSALSKQISWLEDQLGTKLLKRTTRHLSLTESGQQFYEQGRKILDEINTLHTKLHEEKGILRGTLRVSCELISHQSQLIKIIPEFLFQHPEITLELVENTRLSDFATQGIDMAIMNGLALNHQYEQELLGTLKVHVYGAPSYLEKHGTPENPEDLIGHNCLIHVDLDHQARWKFNYNQYVNVQGNFRSNRPGPLIEAARRGLGLIQTSDSLIACYIQEGQLIPVLRDYAEPCADIYAVYPKSPFENKILRVFIEFLKEQKFCSIFCRE
jgi:DNA-binding transcriptional LysR family regulator